MAEREHLLKTFDQQIGTAKLKMEELVEKEPWIKAEEPYFDKPGTIYDFKDLEPL